MKSIRIFLAMVVAVAGIAMSFSNARVVTQRYEKETAISQFTKITAYNPANCILPIETNCTYVAVFQDGFTPPATLPLNATPSNTPGLISITGDGVQRTYVQ